MLRNAREKSGLSIADVSQVIRIQGVHLAAIEDERFGDLPAPTYAFGFVRAYANYLNLDADEAVRRMKLDNADAEASQMLNFPLPTDIERGPSRRMALGAIVIALVVYGIWYMSVQTDAPSEQASDAPQPAIEQQASEIAQPETPAVETPAPAIVEPVEPPAEVPAPVSLAPIIPDIAALTPEAVPSPSPATDPIPAPVIAPPVDAPSAPEVAAESEMVPDEPTPIAPDLPDIAALTPPAAPVPALSPVAEPAPLPQTANTETPADAASGAPAVRLKAINDAWIEVKRADGEVIATRVLPAGQEYVPPNEPGLRLTTGDAGALEIYVNGAIIPSLGRRGDIKRAVLLDPASLTSGPGAN